MTTPSAPTTQAYLAKTGTTTAVRPDNCSDLGIHFTGPVLQFAYRPHDQHKYLNYCSLQFQTEVVFRPEPDLLPLYGYLLDPVATLETVATGFTKDGRPPVAMAEADGNNFIAVQGTIIPRPLRYHLPDRDAEEVVLTQITNRGLNYHIPHPTTPRVEQTETDEEGNTITTNVWQYPDAPPSTTCLGIVDTSVSLNPSRHANQVIFLKVRGYINTGSEPEGKPKSGHQDFHVAILYPLSIARIKGRYGFQSGEVVPAKFSANGARVYVRGLIFGLLNKSLLATTLAVDQYVLLIVPESVNSCSESQSAGALPGSITWSPSPKKRSLGRWASGATTESETQEGESSQQNDDGPQTPTKRSRKRKD